MQRTTVATTARRAFRTVRERQLTFLAASIAYYMLVSLFPLGLLALVVATTVGGATFAARVVGSLDALLSPAGADVLRGALLDASGRGGATVLSALVLLWSGLRVFRGLDVAFSLVYGHGRRKGILDQVRDAVVALVGITVAAAAVGAVTALVAVSGVRIAGIFGPLALAGTLTVAFLPIYVVFPDAGVTVREALPGTVVAAVGWTLLGSLFAVYAAVAGSAALYGLVGGVLLLVTWFYAASVLLLLGAVVNVTLAGGPPTDRHLQQAAGRTNVTMTDDDGDGETPPPGDPDESVEPASEAELASLREDLEAFREDVESRTLHRESVEDDLRAYVRREIRSGHARGWGPYAVLLYGTVMTVGGFYYLSGPWAVLAMVVVWLSTLGLYVVMLLVGAGLNLVELPAKAVGRFRNR